MADRLITLDDLRANPDAFVGKQVRIDSDKGWCVTGEYSGFDAQAEQARRLPAVVIGETWWALELGDQLYLLGDPAPKPALPRVIKREEIQRFDTIRVERHNYGVDESFTGVAREWQPLGRLYFESGYSLKLESEHRVTLLSRPEPEPSTVTRTRQIELESAFDRLVTVVDEAFGLHPVMTPDELVSALENELAAKQETLDTSIALSNEANVHRAQLKSALEAERAKVVELSAAVPVDADDLLRELGRWREFATVQLTGVSIPDNMSDDLRRRMLTVSFESLRAKVLHSTLDKQDAAHLQDSRIREIAREEIETALANHADLVSEDNRVSQLGVDVGALQRRVMALEEQRSLRPASRLRDSDSLPDPEPEPTPEPSLRRIWALDGTESLVYPNAALDAPFAEVVINDRHVVLFDRSLATTKTLFTRDYEWDGCRFLGTVDDFSRRAREYKQGGGK